MVNEERAGDQTDGEQGGVFGKLPASRPGTRSPRRRSETKGKATKAKAAAAPKPKPAAAPRERPAPKPRPKAPPPAREPIGAEAPQGDQRGLDDLAWAGVAAVAEAATLGVRLANRALGALRDNADRR